MFYPCNWSRTTQGFPNRLVIARKRGFQTFGKTMRMKTNRFLLTSVTGFPGDVKLMNWREDCPYTDKRVWANFCVFDIHLIFLALSKTLNRSHAQHFNCYSFLCTLFARCSVGPVKPNKEYQKNWKTCNVKGRVKSIIEFNYKTVHSR